MAGSSKKAIYAALVGNSLIAVTKFVAPGPSVERQTPAFPVSRP